MKDLHLLIWLTQLGLSVAVPLTVFILLGVWLHSSLGWGVWTVYAGIVLGILNAISGFRDALRTMERMSKRNRKPETPPLAFNDHD